MSTKPALDDDITPPAATATSPGLIYLMRAAQPKGINRAIVAQWVLRGADIETSDAHATTPLMFSAAYGHLDVVAYLVGRGARVNTMDKQGYTAFSLAACFGHGQVAAYLKSRGANPNAVAPFLNAARHGRLAALVLLIEHGTRVNLRDRLGNTALILAAARGHFAAVRHLIKAGSDLTLQNGYGDDAASLARRAGQYTIAKYLESSGVSAKVTRCRTLANWWRKRSSF